MNDTEMRDWKPGKILLDEYEVKRTLGKGGMGTVYLVERSADNYLFAVKTLLPKTRKKSGDYLLFLRELRTWIDLPGHPHLVACHFFQTIENRLAIFAEFVDGCSLQEFIHRHHPLDIGHILDFAIQSAWGLQAAHENDVIHQDVKPANILVTRDGIAKLTDFGLSRVKSEQGKKLKKKDAGAGLVSTGGMTLAYCSPEQAAHKKLDFSTDIWSLGVSILEMFTGRVSWWAGTLAGVVLDEYKKKKMAPNSLDMPDAVYAILKRCFAPEPKDRWESMGTLAEALRNAYEEITGTPYPRKEPSLQAKRKSSVKHTRMSSANISWSDPRIHLKKACEFCGEDYEKHRTLVPERQGSRKAQALADLEGYVLAENLMLKALDIVEENMRRAIRMEMLKLFQEKSAILKSIGDYRGTLENYQQAIHQCREMLAERFDPEIADLLGVNLLNSAIACCEKSDYARGFDLYAQAEAVWQDLLRKNANSKGAVTWRFSIALIYMNTALVNDKTGNLDESGRLFDNAIDLLSNLAYSHDFLNAEIPLALCYFNYSNFHKKKENYSDAEAACDASMKIWVRKVDNGETNFRQYIASCLSQKGSIDQLNNHPESAVRWYKDSISIWEELVYRNEQTNLFPQLSLTYFNLAETYSMMDAIDDALSFFDKGFAIIERLVFLEDQRERIPDLIKATLNRGELYIKNNRKGDARDSILKIRKLLLSEAEKRDTPEFRFFKERMQELLARCECD